MKVLATLAAVGLAVGAWWSLGAQTPSVPDKPTGLAIASIDEDGVTISWDDPGDSSISGYQILRRNPRVDPAGVFHEHVADTGTATTSFADPEVQPGESYTYRVKAINAQGLSQRSRYKRADVPASASQLAPSGLTAAVTNGVSLSWTKPEARAYEVSGYRIERAAGDGAFSILVSNTSTTETSYIDATANTTGATYGYRVRALRGSSVSEPSDRVDITLVPDANPDEDPLALLDDEEADSALDGSEGGQNSVRESIQFIGERSAAQDALDLSRYPAFDLHADNSNPRSIWSDGTTLWVGQNNVTGDKVLAYHLVDDPNTVANEYGTRDAAKDLDPMNDEGHIVTGDDDHFWLTDQGLVSRRTQPIARSGTTTLSAFVYCPALTNTEECVQFAWGGTASDGSRIWYADSSRVVRSYWIVDDPETADNEYGTYAETIEFSFIPLGLYTDGEFLWAVENEPNGRVEARRLSDGGLAPRLGFRLHPDNADAWGIWSNGVTMFVLDNGDKKIYTYRFRENATGPTTSGGTLRMGNAAPGDVLTIDTSTISDANGLPDPLTPTYQWQHNDAFGWADLSGETGATLTVTSAYADGHVRVRASFNDATGYPEVVYSNAIYVRTQDAVLDFTHYEGFDLHSSNGNPRSIWSDGTTLWVGQNNATNDKVLAYHLKDNPDTEANEYGTRDPAKDLDPMNDEGHIVTGDDDHFWLTDQGQRSKRTLPIARSGTTTLSSFVYCPALGNTAECVLIAWGGTASDGSRIWYPDSTVFVRSYWIADDPETSDNEYGTYAKTIRFSFVPLGLYTDGEFLWAVENNPNGRVEARRLIDGSLVEHLGFTLDAGNADAWGIWSNGVTMFILDNFDERIYTYRYRDNASGAALRGWSSMDGSALVGDELEAVTTAITDPNGLPDPLRPAYQWQRNDGGGWTDIAGETSSDYTVVDSDIGSRLRVTISFTDNDGFAEAIHSFSVRVNAEGVMPELRFYDSSYDLPSLLTNARTAWGDGRTLWIGQEDTLIYGLHLYDDPATDADETMTRDASRDVPTEEVTAYLVTGYGRFLYTVEEGPLAEAGPQVFVHRLPALGRSSSHDFVGLTSFSPTGLTTDGRYLYLNRSDRKLHATYLFDDPATTANEYGTANTDADISISGCAGPGIWIEGALLWVQCSGSVQAYSFPDAVRLSALDVTLHNDNDDGTGVWGNGATMFVPDHVDDKIYTYRYRHNGSGLAISGGSGEGGVGVFNDVLTPDFSSFTDPDGVPDPLDPAYQWQRNRGEGWVDIRGAEDETYVVAGADAGAQVRLLILYTDTVGNRDLAASNGVAVEFTPAPSIVAGEPHVSAGGYHSCYLDGSGSIDCVGRNDEGQRNVPDPGSGKTWTMVSAGQFHSCGLIDDGTVLCWGHNSFGQAPTTAKSATSGEFVSVDAGPWHTCALTDEGEFECWGRNDDGQLVDGSEPKRGEKPEADFGKIDWIDKPESDATVLMVSAGGSVLADRTSEVSSYSYTCVLWSTGDIGCAGYTPAAWDAKWHGIKSNGGTGKSPPYRCNLVLNGRLYENTSRDGCAPGNPEHYWVLHVPELTGELVYTSVSVGGKHACATLSDRSIRCWGRRHDGALGFPQTETGDVISAKYGTRTGMAYGTPSPPTRDGWISVSAGQRHSCATAPSPGRLQSEIVCWGNKVFFDSISENYPKPRSGGKTAAEDSPAMANARLPSAGAWHTCWVHGSRTDPNAERVSCKGDQDFRQSQWKWLDVE